VRNSRMWTAVSVAGVLAWAYISGYRRGRQTVTGDEMALVEATREHRPHLRAV
jgi:hypothetical protein